MNTEPTTRTRYFAGGAAVASLILAAIAVQCSAPDSGPASPAGSRAEVADAAGLRAWDVVYGVLQHPRCVNCHPAGDEPLQGDAGTVHELEVRRGEDGRGLFAMRCEHCHASANAAGAHMPPGAPNWHLPSRAIPLVFEGRGKGDLCRQMRDATRNGGRTPAQVLEHLTHDPLVLWGWAPGEGRTPIPTAHADLVEAARVWVGSGCACPE